jgi:hypothetical protein
MPKNVNISKAAAAAAQSEKAIRAAIKAAEPEAWMSVQKRLGNGFFSLMDHRGHLCRGTPRGLFTKGSMPVQSGSVVIVSGNPALGVEIIGVISSLREAEQMARSGIIPAEVIRSAKAHDGAAAEAEAEDPWFESAAAEEAPEARGGLKQQRKAAETRAAIAERASALLGGRGAFVAADVVVDGPDGPDVNVDEV